MNEINMHHFSVSGISNMCLVVIEEANLCAIPDCKTHPTFKSLNVIYTTFQGSIDRAKKSDKSGAVMAADKRRDDALVGLRAIVNGFLHAPDPVIKDKAQQVWNVLDKFGAGVEKQKDVEETSKLLSILTGLDKPEIAAKVDSLAIRVYVEELREANAEFQTAWGSRESDVADFRNTTSATSQVGDAQKAVNDYYDYVVAMSKYDAKREEWAKLASAIYSRYLTIKQSQLAGKSRKKEEPAS